MFPAPVLPPALESANDRIARVFADECAAAALEVFERHRLRGPRPCTGPPPAPRDHGEGVVVPILGLLVAFPRGLFQCRTRTARTADPRLPGRRPSSRRGPLPSRCLDVVIARRRAVEPSGLRAIQAARLPTLQAS